MPVISIVANSCLVAFKLSFIDSCQQPTHVLHVQCDLSVRLWLDDILVQYELELTTFLKWYSTNSVRSYTLSRRGHISVGRQEV